MQKKILQSKITVWKKIGSAEFIAIHLTENIYICGWKGSKKHGNGIALIFARTETKCFFDNVWNSADALLFVKGRIRFYHVSGIQGGTSGAPSVFIAYGKENALALKNSGIAGHYVEL